MTGRFPARRRGYLAMAGRGPIATGAPGSIASAQRRAAGPAARPRVRGHRSSRPGSDGRNRSAATGEQFDEKPLRKENGFRHTVGVENC